MYGYSYRYSAKPGLLSFDPLAINGLQMYLNKKNATVSSWLDQSPNAFDFVQTTAPKQPTISSNSVDFDGVDDFLNVSTLDALSDASGVLFFSNYYNSLDKNILFATSNNSVNDEYFEVRIHTDGSIRLLVNNSGVFNDIRSTSLITNGSYFYCYIKSTGTSYEINLNGVVETLNISSGTNNGEWLGDLVSRDNLTIGANLRLTNVFGYNKSNKLIYSNAALTPLEISNINNFMANPNN